MQLHMVNQTGFADLPFSAPCQGPTRRDLSGEFEGSAGPDRLLSSAAAMSAWFTVPAGSGATKGASNRDRLTRLAGLEIGLSNDRAPGRRADVAVVAEASSKPSFPQEG